MKRILVVVDDTTALVVLQSAKWLSVPTTSVVPQEDGLPDTFRLARRKALAEMTSKLIELPAADLTPSKLADLLLLNYCTHVYWRKMTDDHESILKLTPFKVIPALIDEETFSDDLDSEPCDCDCGGDCDHATQADDGCDCGHHHHHEEVEEEGETGPFSFAMSKGYVVVKSTRPEVELSRDREELSGEVASGVEEEESDSE